MDSANEAVWFSCSIRFAEYTDDSTLFRFRRSVYLLRSFDHVGARKRALQVGREQERIYPNAAGSLIRVALVEVETLDMLGDVEDGLEVCHWPTDNIDPPPFAWDHQFNPDESQFYTTL